MRWGSGAKVARAGGRGLQLLHARYPPFHGSMGIRNIRYLCKNQSKCAFCSRSQDIACLIY